MQIFPASRRPRARASRLAVVALLSLATSGLAEAQTDYYNLDRGRPLTVEDARVLERNAVEWQIAPFHAVRGSGGSTSWGLEPSLSWGVIPRTQLELAVPFDAGARGSRRGIAGLELSAMHALNAETIGIPALAATAALLLPVGSNAASSAYATVGAAATRTTSFGRVHLNGSVTAGPGLTETERSGAELSRWLLGVAADRAFPLRSMLVGAELVARQPIGAGERVEWGVGSGLRLQLDPRFSIDAGVGRTFTGGGEWTFRFGTAYSFAVVRGMGGGR